MSDIKDVTTTRFNQVLQRAMEKSREDDDAVYIGHHPGSSDEWDIFGDGCDGSVPDCLLLVNAEGNACIVENRPVPYDCLKNSLQAVISARKAFMNALEAQSPAQMDAAQEAMSKAIKQAEANLYQIP